MAKKSEIRYGACQNPECMNFGINDVIPADGNCPICHTPMKPEEEDTSTDQFDMLNDEEALDGGLGNDRKSSKGKSKKGKIIAIIAAALVVFGGAGYGIYAWLSRSSKPTGITLDKSKITMKVGETVMLTPKVNPEGTKATFIFKRKGKNVKVSVGGEITALKAGEAIILVKCEENPELHKICRITIEAPTKEILIKSITINDQSVVMKKGEKKTLNISVIPEKFDEKIVVSSSDESIVSVSENGDIVANNAGDAVITFMGEKSGIKANTKVAVKTKGTDGRPGPISVNLGYGIYTGDGTGNKPNGFGDIVFTRHKYINSSYTAESGYKIRNARFVNGKLWSGTLYDENGIKVGFIDANNNL